MADIPISGTFAPYVAGGFPIVHAADLDQFFCTAGTGLNLNFLGGKVRFSGALLSTISPGTIALTDNTTNFVYVSIAAIVSKSTVAFPSKCIPIAQVVTSSGAITSITDKRAFLDMVVRDHADMSNLGANDHPHYVLASLYDANTILIATTDDTPIPLTVAEERIVGRITGGAIDDLTAAQIATFLKGTELGKRMMYLGEVIAAATALTTGDAKRTVVIPSELNGWNLINAQARVYTVATGATLVNVQVRNVTDAVDMLSTPITIDASALTSYTATTPSVVDTGHDDVATADILAVDIDAIGNTTPGNGLDVILTWQLT